MIRFLKSSQAGVRRAALSACLIIWLGTTGSAACEQFEEFTYTDNGTTITIKDYPSSATGSVFIPATIAGKPVTAIGVDAFRDCTGIVSVTMPNSVSSIDSNAFNNCQAVTSLTLSTGLTSIGNFAFLNCLKLTSITLPSGLTSIPTGTFWNCSNLQSVTIPSSVTDIQSQAFNNCGALTSIILPPGTTTLGNRAFFNCKALETIAVPGLVNSIGTEVFSNCRSLTTIMVAPSNATFSSVGGVLFNKAETTLIAFPPGVSGSYDVPAAVEVIGAKAFYTCTKLVGINLPPSLLSVGQEAFSTCSSLLHVTFSGDAPSLVPNAFQQEDDNFVIYYPASATGYDDEPWTLLIYPVIPVGSSDPFGNWLSSNSLPTNSNPATDSNGDGVSLLMAYALGLNPHANLAGMAPVPVFAFGQASLSYPSGALGITYRVEWSNDLQNWSTNGVTVSDPELNQVRTATVAISGSPFYVRLAAEY